MEQRKLLSIVFTDIKGYTAIMEKDEAKALHIVSAFEKHITSTCKRHQGTIIQFMGDGSLIVFENSYDAVAFGIGIQSTFLEEEPMPHRVGIHTGEVLLKNGNIYGDSVNVAARIESMGVPGSLLISDTTMRLIKNKKDFSTTSMGEFLFKNQSKPMELFAVTNPPLVIPERKDLKGKTAPQKPKSRIWISILAVLGLLATTWAGFQWMNSAQTLSHNGWEDEWNIKVEDQDNTFQEGWMEFRRTDGILHGDVKIWYDPQKTISVHIELTEIKEWDNYFQTISGNWTSNIQSNTPDKGTFKLSKTNNHDTFKGEFKPHQSEAKYIWTGSRE